MMWPPGGLRQKHVVVSAMQEAERQAGLDTILAALAQKGAQEAALAQELAALRGQEQVGDAGTSGQLPGCNHLCTAACPFAAGRQCSWPRLTSTSPCSKCLRTPAVGSGRQRRPKPLAPSLPKQAAAAHRRSSTRLSHEHAAWPGTLHSCWPCSAAGHQGPPRGA